MRMPDRSVRARLRRVSAVVLAAALAAGLGACQAVPGTGPVQEGLARLDQGEQQLEFNPGLPIEGADQEAIVRGFIRAATSSANDYEIAREFAPYLGVEYSFGDEPDRVALLLGLRTWF